jgi:triacylglycerol lipase
MGGMLPVHHVYLLPGFFGFVQFGKLVYFSHVREFLETRLSELGLPAELPYVRVSPTASIRARAGGVRGYARATAPAGGGPLHFVGHSTGGIDARLAVTPGASLDAGPVEAYAARVRSVVTLVAPHRGTPLASFFATMLGQKILRLLSLGTATALRQGRWPLSILVRIGAALARAGGPDSRTAALLDHLAEDLLGRLPVGDRDRVTLFVRAVSDDQALLHQLAPETMDVFNASARDRPGVRYGCVVARARPPGVTGYLNAGLSPSAQAMYALYAWLHRQVAASAARAVRPILDEAQRTALRSGLGGLPSPADNDGIVPTLSQIWGDVLYAVPADHLDVIGHFDDASHIPPHRDWITTRSGFDRKQFEAMWTLVADFIVGASREG